MESILEAGLQATEWLQTNYPQLLAFFSLISALGTEEFYLAIIPLIYWSIDKKLGRELAYVFLLATGVNGLLKHAFRGPRPFWLSPALAQGQEASYGVPSGHTQLATAFYLLLAGWIRKPWVWALAILMTFLMGLSRIYLGVHFIHDVVVGFLIALLILLGYVLWRRYAAARLNRQILGYRLMLAVLVPLGLAGIYMAVRLLIGAPDETVRWASYNLAAETSGLESVATAVGALLGAGIGLTLEASRIRFRSAGSRGQRAARYLLGIVVTIILWAGLDALFPSEPLWLAALLRILRYTVVLLWVSYYAPMAFVYLGWAEQEPERELAL
jgi:membrane-associated phospholipid phosphatase